MTSECRKVSDAKHDHRGKSSESRLDRIPILTNLPIARGQVILDAGCGNGYMAEEFATRTGETGKVYALDSDASSIDVLKLETAGTNIEPLVGDITKDTGLATSSIDLIYMSLVLHGFSDAQMEAVYKEVDRLLKPKGRLAIVEIKKQQTPFGPPLEIRFSPEDLRRAIPLKPTQLMDVSEHFYMQIFEQ
jgi:ubiquinone/menaquinone biosynthesis C-methylase UbiE